MNAIDPLPKSVPASDVAGPALHIPVSRNVQAVIFICWGLIFLKSCLVVWTVQRYHLPFNPMWVVGPTVTFAALATAVYYYMRE